MSKLNAKLVAHATPKDTEYRLPDGGGLFLRVRPSGAKSWLFCFRLPGSRTLLQMTLGALDDVSLKDARTTLPELRKLVSKGLDPRNARAAAKTENTQAITMQTLFDAWIEFVKLAGEVTTTWVKRHEDRWRLHLKTPLSNILARDVTRAHLATALDAMTRKGIKEETRKALTTLNLMLDYALTRHHIEHNPARILKPKDFAATASRPRDRTLSLKELRQLWMVLDHATTKQKEAEKTSSISLITATAIKLLILTGARRGEVAAMRWDELDLKKRIWSLSSARTKNRQSHTVYLSELAIELIEKLHPLTGHSIFVFDTGRDTGHIHTDSLTTAINRLTKANPTDEKSKKAPLAGLKPFTIHDLRRSAATAWGEHLKTAPHVIEHMLNHQPINKLVATYQRAIYAEEQKAAWLAWGAMTEHQIARDPCNIIPIKTAANT
jgi:integrase